MIADECGATGRRPKPSTPCSSQGTLQAGMSSLLVVDPSTVEEREVTVGPLADGGVV
jgi:hypothetical protein